MCKRYPIEVQKLRNICVNGTTLSALTMLDHNPTKWTQEKEKKQLLAIQIREEDETHLKKKIEIFAILINRKDLRKESIR